MKLRLKKQSYRLAEQLLHPSILEDLESLLIHSSIDVQYLSRPNFNDLLREIFKNGGWENYPSVFNQIINPFAKIEYIKDNVGLEVGFRHTSLIGYNLIKFQISPSYNSDQIDVGIYLVTTQNFQKQIKKSYGQNWAGAMTFEKADRYLRHFKSTLQMPIYLVGIDVA